MMPNRIANTPRSAMSHQFWASTALMASDVAGSAVKVPVRPVPVGVAMMRSSVRPHLLRTGAAHERLRRSCAQAAAAGLP